MLKKTLCLHPVFYTIGILLVIQVKGDGDYLFPENLPMEQWMLIVFSFWFGLVTFIGFSVYWLVTEKKFQTQTLPPLHGFAFIVIPIACIFLIATLHSLQSVYYSSAGYRVDNQLILNTSIFGLLPFLGYWLKVRITKKHSLLMVLFCVLLSTLIMKSIPLNLFPISSTRSDLLPILKEAGIAIYNGENPYKYYMLDNGVNTANVRFPGLMLAYLPFSVAGLDLRFTSIIIEVVIFIILIVWVVQISKKRAGKQQIIWELSIPLICFMMFPYWHYRHELYETPFWLVLLLTLFAFDKGHKLSFSLGLSILCITHQWGILFAPFLLVGFFKKKGFASTALCIMSVTLVFWIAYKIILKENLNDFYMHTFGTYDGLIVYASSMSLGLWFAKFEILDLLFYFKIIPQLFLMYLAGQYGQRTPVLVGLLALSLTCLLAFNPVAWTYQYLLVVFLIILGWYFREESFA